MLLNKAVYQRLSYAFDCLMDLNKAVYRRMSNGF